MPIHVVVLGARGMLGAVALQALSMVPGLTVRGSTRDGVGGHIAFDLEQVDATTPSQTIPAQFTESDYIVNCCAVLKPECREDVPAAVARAMQVNGRFPNQLAAALSNQRTRIIHISTNGVFSGRDGPYAESAQPDAQDLYGRSKALGETIAPNVLNLRTSIIGNEDGRHGRSLLAWIRSQPSGAQLKGFTNHLRNGLTTYQLVAVILGIITNDLFLTARAEGPIHHVANPATISKFELLQIVNEQFQCGLQIHPAVAPQPSNATLRATFPTIRRLVPALSFSDAIAELTTRGKA